jgi:hypothetical protein
MLPLFKTGHGLSQAQLPVPLEEHQQRFLVVSMQGNDVTGRRFSLQPFSD